MTKPDLLEQLREEGIEDPRDVKKCISGNATTPSYPPLRSTRASVFCETGSSSTMATRGFALISLFTPWEAWREAAEKALEFVRRFA